jgi:sugar phosphate isomerase/epimerase
MTRRELLAAAAACASPSVLAARSHFDKTRISAITDEIAVSTDDAIAFAHKYGLTSIELRNRPQSRPEGKKEYFTLPEPEIKADALRFKKEGLKVSFLNTSLLKFTWPGSEAARTRPETPEAREKRIATEQARWDKRLETLKQVIRCAHIVECDKIRVFAGARVAETKTMYSRIAETIGGEMAAIAEKEKVYLLLENEGSQNIATCQEMADIMKLMPSKWVGLNWDPHNAHGKETVYPDGYALLPKKRILNVQVKGKGVMPESPERQDWKTLIQALDKDGYKGKIGLETHIFDGTLIAAAHVSMEEIMRIVRGL